MEEAVLLKDIVKIFPGTVANDHVTVSIRKNSIHGIIGENGAGKTTLMKQLYGMYQPDGGEIFLKGERVVFHSPKAAIEHRIGSSAFYIGTFHDGSRKYYFGKTAWKRWSD